MTARQDAGHEPLDITLHSRHRPELPGGDYTVEVSHHLKAEATGKLAGLDRQLGATRKVTVVTPRFSLGPDAVFAVFPPANTTGNYRTTLAHVTLNGSTLPFERTLSNADADKGTPWMTLLVLADTEVLRHGDDTTTTGALGDLVDPKKAGATLLPPALGRLTDVEKALQCRVVDLPMDTVKAVLPKRRELKHLAHVRDVAVRRSRRAADEWRPGHYSVLLANRLPLVTPRRYTAVLVSLDGHGEHAFLGGAVAHPNAESVRFLALHSWTFHCRDQGAGDFGTAIRELLADSGDDWTLRLPAKSPPDDGRDPTAREETANRLRRGHVPVSHRLPDGSRTIAWYRGPFTAVKPPEPDEGATVSSEADSHVHLSRWGVFDLGYPAAHALGRLLTLGDSGLRAQLAALSDDGLRALHHALGVVDPSAGSSGSAAASVQALVQVPDFAKSVAEKLKDLRNTLPPRQDSAAADETSAAGTTSSLLAEAASDRCLSAVDVVAAAHTTRLRRAGLDAVALLRRAPFHYLVPDPAMLPEESIRFFSVDRTWLAALMAGAASPGSTTTLDQRMIRQVLSTSVVDTPACGMVIRSRLVVDWPELVVEAHADGSQVARSLWWPAPDILLVLWDERPSVVWIREPPNALRFGIDSLDTSGTEPKPGELTLRHASGTKIGESNGDKLSPLSGYLRDTSVARGQVFDIDGATSSTLVAALKSKLKIEITPAILGLQLLNSPQQLVVESA
ncbi:hypothetical protein AB0A74_05300 [Saccharothrix sp. NPDC042600]|uniref:hypothetical protein n=1 Tax=Saccharothrix TaxID=2071 RepID=UPI0033C6F910|nr:hypothetical protein GCM10017745_37160 [Saccharothrix mutabilis subsp. capreolus]